MHSVNKGKYNLHITVKTTGSSVDLSDLKKVLGKTREVWCYDILLTTVLFIKWSSILLLCQEAFIYSGEWSHNLGIWIYWLLPEPEEVQEKNEWVT